MQPAALDDLGLEQSLRQLTERFARAGALEVNVEVEPLPVLPAAVEVGAYRILQESLTNVVRHSGASTVRVALRLGPECLELCVADNGTGDVRPRPDGVGLGSMRARAEEIGGRFDLVGTPGRGTTIRASLPLATGTPT
jgi:two-component system NarL family sensor kinase